MKGSDPSGGVDEAHDVLEAAVGGDRGEVVADHVDLGAAGRAEVPGEAHVVVVGVRGGGERELDAGVLLLGAGDHRVDPVGPCAGARGVDVGRVVGERLGDQRAAALRDALLPRLQVAVDDGGDGGGGGVGHGRQPAGATGPR